MQSFNEIVNKFCFQILDDSSLIVFLKGMAEVREPLKQRSFLSTIVEVAQKFPTTIVQPNIIGHLLKSLEFFSNAIDRGLEKKQSPNLREALDFVHNTGLNLLYKDKNNRTSVFRKNSVLMLFECAFVLLVRSRNLFQEFLIGSVETLLQRYGEYDSAQHSDFFLSAQEEKKFREGICPDELIQLVEFFNYMMIICCMSEKEKLGMLYIIYNICYILVFVLIRFDMYSIN